MTTNCIYILQTITLQKILKYVWDCPDISMSSKFELCLVDWRMFKIISSIFMGKLKLNSKFGNPFGNVITHLQSPYCLLKTIHTVEIDPYVYEPLNLQLDNLSTLLKDTEEIIVKDYKFADFLTNIIPQLSPKLKSIKIRDISGQDFDKEFTTLCSNLQPQHVQLLIDNLTVNIKPIHPPYEVEEILKISGSSQHTSATVQQQLQSLNIYTGLKKLELTSFSPLINHFLVPSIIQNVTTLILGRNFPEPRYFVKSYYYLDNPAQFFQLLQTNKVLTSLDLYLFNQTGFNDYKESFFNYLKGNETLTNLSIGFIRNREYLQLIASKSSIKTLCISMSERDIVFPSVRHLTLSSRRDINIYYQLCNIRKYAQENTNYQLKSLSIKFYQYHQKVYADMISHLPFLLQDLPTVESVCIEYPPYEEPRFNVLGLRNITSICPNLTKFKVIHMDNYQMTTKVILNELSQGEVVGKTNNRTFRVEFLVYDQGDLSNQEIKSNNFNYHYTNAKRVYRGLELINWVFTKENSNSSNDNSNTDNLNPFWDGEEELYEYEVPEELDDNHLYQYTVDDDYDQLESYGPFDAEEE